MTFCNACETCKWCAANGCIPIQTPEPLEWPVIDESLIDQPKEQK